MWRLYANRMPFFCKELEHPQILVTAGQGSGGGGVSWNHCVADSEGMPFYTLMCEQCKFFA